MHTAHTVEEARALSQEWRAQRLRIGLVPTMGYLHEGHASLMAAAREGVDKLVVSIFVNPAQFGPTEDLDRYPRDFARDSELCSRMGVDLIFAPDAAAMYPAEFYTSVSVRGLTEGLCGKSRPIHFSGVCTVVCKLFNIIAPDAAYFGQKDAQQLAVIRQMVRDLNMQVAVVGCPIVRESDGLAKSSRNAYLNAEERAAAPALFRALRLAADAATQGARDSDALLSLIRGELTKEPLLRVDYAEIVDASSLRPVQRLAGPALVALAAFIGKTRLIDNILIDGGGSAG